MELTNLRYFTVLAKELHFRKAAGKLNMTQAPLSAAIKKLEEELEVKLFERTSRSVRLTPEGEFFKGEADAILQRAELAKNRLKNMVSGRERSLSIGYNEPSLNTFLPELLARCRSHRKKLFLELQELESPTQLEKLRAGALDIGFVRSGGLDLEGLGSSLVYREDYLLVMPCDHPLAGKERPGVNDLAGKSIILFARDVNPVIFDQLVSLLTPERGLPPRFRQDARNKNSMLAMVKAGFGAALLPRSCCPEAGSGLIAKPLSIPLPSVNIMAVWSRERMTEPLRDIIKLLPEGK